MIIYKMKQMSMSLLLTLQAWAATDVPCVLGLLFLSLVGWGGRNQGDWRCWGGSILLTVDQDGGRRDKEGLVGTGREEFITRPGHGGSERVHG